MGDKKVLAIQQEVACLTIWTAWVEFGCFHSDYFGSRKLLFSLSTDERSIPLLAFLCNSFGFITVRISCGKHHEHNSPVLSEELGEQWRIWGLDMEMMTHWDPDQRLHQCW
jgi:hypothetical protein